ncbi:K(lysine) acetyltransferase [Coemansia brasiliensis]|uniref:histone acetyltransferase n=1 Tax=Coemansia brasiliensis TaxID=2650707 RepID=A0A9W8I4K7_9FUNG|nr:K(lysine) acetyltransferase [Coemansia brasiliensis]
METSKERTARAPKKKPYTKEQSKHDAITPAKGKELSEEASEIQRIILGNYSIATWYSSPYPDEYKDSQELYICQQCLKYMRYRETLEAHCCLDPFPRGRCVYEDASVALYEVDGKAHTLYCQNLCLLSKLFLDQKTIYYDIGSFLFYVLLTKQPRQQQLSSVSLSGADNSVAYTFVGYFSKEKVSIERNNLACILVLPPFRGQSYGQMLIELSYELTKFEGTTGGPEQPLSSQGFHSYRSYWRRAIVQALLGTTLQTERYLHHSCGRRRHTLQALNLADNQRIYSVSRLAQLTGIRSEDVLFTLEDLGLLRCWHGKYVVCISDETIRKVIAERSIHPGMRIDPNGLLAGSNDDDDLSDSSSNISCSDHSN